MARINIVDATQESKRAYEVQNYMSQSGKGNCVARAFTHATSFSYDDISNYITSITKEKYAVAVPYSVVNEVATDFDFTIEKAVKNTRIKTVAQIASLHKNCIAICGEKRSLPSHAVAIVNNVIHDSFDSSYMQVSTIYFPTELTPVPKATSKKATVKSIVRRNGEVIGEFEKLVDAVLKAKRANTKLSWVKLIEQMGLLRQDGYKIRRSNYFQNQLIDNEKGWALKPAK